MKNQDGVEIYEKSLEQNRRIYISYLMKCTGNTGKILLRGKKINVASDKCSVMKEMENSTIITRGKEMHRNLAE